jgi:hypothetical protein
LLSYCAGNDLFETLSMKTAVTGSAPKSAFRTPLLHFLPESFIFIFTRVNGI